MATYVGYLCAPNRNKGCYDDIILISGSSVVDVPASLPVFEDKSRKHMSVNESLHEIEIIFQRALVTHISSNSFIQRKNPILDYSELLSTVWHYYGNRETHRKWRIYQPLLA